MGSLCAAVILCLSGLGLLSAAPVPFAIGEWEPYTGHALEQRGMVTEIVSAACRAGGLRADYRFFPWKRAESSVEGGTFFATFPYQITEDRAVTFHFSEVLWASSNGILYRRGSPRAVAIESAGQEGFRGVRVGTLAGSDAVNLPLRKLGATVEEVQAIDQNLRKLEADRLDCVIEDKAVLNHALRRVYGSDPVKLERFGFAASPFGQATEYRLLVSRKYPNALGLLAQFHVGLKRIKASGEYERILKDWGL